MQYVCADWWIAGNFSHRMRNEVSSDSNYRGILAEVTWQPLLEREKKKKRIQQRKGVLGRRTPSDAILTAKAGAPL